MSTNQATQNAQVQITARRDQGNAAVAGRDMYSSMSKYRISRKQTAKLALFSIPSGSPRPHSESCHGIEPMSHGMSVSVAGELRAQVVPATSSAAHLWQTPARLWATLAIIRALDS